MGLIRWRKVWRLKAAARRVRALAITAPSSGRRPPQAAADALGLLPSTLCEKMKRLGLRESGLAPEP